VQIDPAVNLEALARAAHSFGEVVGLGLRNMAQCPIELNLMPKSIRKRQAFNQKKPYFIATLLSLVLALVAVGWFYDAKVVAGKRNAIAQVQAHVEPLQRLAESLDLETAQVTQLKQEADLIAQWAEERQLWLDIVRELRVAMLGTETRMEAELKSKGAKAGVWIDRFVPEIPGSEEVAVVETPQERRSPTMGMTPEMMKRYGLSPEMIAPTPTPEAPPPSTNEITTINVTCSAINLQKYSPVANVNLAQYLQAQLQSRTNLFSPKETLLKPSFTPPEEDANTFSFELTLKLQRPIKIN